MADMREDSDREREIETLFALIRDRYGPRLDGVQLADLHKTVEGIVDAARALRAVRLGQGDEPAQPFAPLRAEG
jgi:hypothetical protein